MFLRSSRLLVASGLFAAATVGSVGHLASASATTLPLLRVGSATVIEGDTGQAVVDVPVDLSTPSSQTVSVTYAITGGGSATSGVDFVAKSAKIKLKPGQVNKQISVRINGDFSKEGTEHVAVTLSSAVNAIIDVAAGGVTIQDDDSDSQTGIQVNIGNVSVVETDGGTHIAELPVTLSRPAPSKLRIFYEIDCSTAIPGTDFTQKQSGSISFGVGAQSKVIKFTVLADQTPEMVKAILDTIKVTVGSATVHEADGEGRIIDDDGTPPDPAALDVGDVARMSVASDGTEAESAPAGLCGGSEAIGSTKPVTSADGRYTAFVSGASNLVPGDTNGANDVFVHDRVTGATERVNVTSAGAQAPANAAGAPFLSGDSPSISADGRYVTFWEFRPLVTGVSTYQGEIYLHDRVTGTTELISKTAAGTPASSVDDWQSPVSADGRYVAFVAASDGYTVSSDPLPATSDVFVRDRVLATNTLVSAAYDGSVADGIFPSISSDGRYVAFQSRAAAIVPGDTNGCPDTFVRDMVAGTSQRVDLTTAGDEELPALQPGGPGTSCGIFGYPTLSADGSTVAWLSSAWNEFGLSAPDYLTPHLYVRDLASGTTQLIDDQAAWNPGHMLRWPALSGDGSVVAYDCECDASSTPTSIWLYDRSSGERTETGDRADGTLADDVNHLTMGGGTLSGDGHYLVFTSWATNLLPGDGDMNDVSDVYIKRLS